MLALAVLGCLVLMVSLIATNRSVVGQVVPLSSVQFYMRGPILPDHPAYPLLMVRDRVALMSATQESRILLKVKYADERRARALLLLRKGKPDLAVSTFTKSQKYLLEAARLSILLQTPSQTREQFSQILDQSLFYLETVSAAARDEQRAVLEQLAADTRVVQGELSQ